MPEAARDLYDNLLTIKEAADYLACGRGTIYKLLRAKELSVVDLAHEDNIRPDVRIRLSTLNEYIERHDRSYEVAPGEPIAIRNPKGGNIHRFAGRSPFLVGYRTFCGNDTGTMEPERVPLSETHPSQLCKHCWKNDA